MANIKDLVSFISRWEGGYVNNPADSGGPTNRGVTLETWRKTGYDKNGDGNIDEADVMRITHEEMLNVVLKPHYWDNWQADLIQNQSIANLLVDWMWLSGPRTIGLVQEILGVKQDGIVGNQTLHALNSNPDKRLLFDVIKTKRVSDIHAICKKYPKNQEFKRGWLDRVAAIKFLPVIVFMMLFCGLTSCRTAGRYIAPAEIRMTTNSATDQEMTTEQQQHFTALSDTQVTTMLTDSVSETLVVAFKLLLPADTGKLPVPVHGYGKAVITRNSKKQSTVISAGQQVSSMQRSDSSRIKTVAAETKQTLQRHIQPRYRLKPVLTGLMIVLLALWLYILFRFRK